MKSVAQASSLLTKSVAPAGCDFKVDDSSQILVAPGGCDPLYDDNLPSSTSC